MITLDSLDSTKIKKDTPIPYHYQLSELLRQEIESGDWKVGEQIPVEEDLCAYFSLSSDHCPKVSGCIGEPGFTAPRAGVWNICG